MPLATRHLRLIALSAGLATNQVQAALSGEEPARLENLLPQLDAMMQPLQASTDRSEHPSR